MFFARGLKCGGFGAIGLGREFGPAANAPRSFSSDARAIDPRPSAHRLKNCRRVKYCAANRSGARTFQSAATFDDSPDIGRIGGLLAFRACCGLESPRSGF